MFENVFFAPRMIKPGPEIEYAWGPPKSGTQHIILSRAGAKTGTHFGVPNWAPIALPPLALCTVFGAVAVSSERVRPSLARTWKSFRPPRHVAEGEGGLEKYSLQCAIAPIDMTSRSDTLQRRKLSVKRQQNAHSDQNATLQTHA